MDQKRKFEQVESQYHQFGWIKSETACICFTWLPPPYSLLDQKLYPAYQGSADHPPFCSVTRTLICSLKKHFYEIEIILRKHLILINLINWTLYKWVIHVSRNWKLKGSPVFLSFWDAFDFINVGWIPRNFKIFIFEPKLSFSNENHENYR